MISDLETLEISRVSNLIYGHGTSVKKTTNESLGRLVPGLYYTNNTYFRIFSRGTSLESWKQKMQYYYDVKLI